MNPGKLKHKIEIWGKTKTKNELKETTYTDSLIKSINAEIVPQTGKLQKQEIETILSTVTHKIIVRYKSGKDITQDMFIIFRGKRFDIKYILNPYYKDETLEIFCTEVIE